MTGEFIALDSLRQPGGKLVHAWAVEADFDPARLRSNTFSMEWPPRSGRQASFPEIDRAAWFGLDEARSRILIGQVGFLDALAASWRTPIAGRRNGPRSAATQISFPCWDSTRLADDDSARRNPEIEASKSRSEGGCVSHGFS